MFSGETNPIKQLNESWTNFVVASHDFDSSLDGQSSYCKCDPISNFYVMFN